MEMMMENSLTYRLSGDYYFPLMDIEEPIHIGMWGRMRQQYLEEHRPGLYARLMLSGKLAEHLERVDQDARERMEVLVRQMAEAEGVDEKMKAEDQMGWVGAMNNIAYRAREIILSEMINN